MAVSGQSVGAQPTAAEAPVGAQHAVPLLTKVPKSTTIVAVCEQGGRSSHAVQQFRKLEYKNSPFCPLDSCKREGYELEAGDLKAMVMIYNFTRHRYCNVDKQTMGLDQHGECACARRYRECVPGEEFCRGGPRSVATEMLSRMVWSVPRPLSL